MIDSIPPSLFQELSKITMPVIFNEPLSFLQRLTEYMEHTYLIHQANALDDSIERMKVKKKNIYIYMTLYLSENTRKNSYRPNMLNNYEYDYWPINQPTFHHLRTP